MPTGTLTISQYIANPPQQVDVNSLLEVRGWYTRDYISIDGVTPIFGNSTNGEQGPYYSTTPSLNGSGEVVVPAHDVQITVGANPTANYFEGLWIDGAFVMLLMPNTNSATGWQIPSVYGDPIAYDEIATYNRARRLVYPPDTYFTADQTIQEIERLAGNFDYMAVGINGIGQASFPPAVASAPIVLMENDPRVGSYHNILAYGAATTNTAAQNAVAIANAVTAALAVNAGIYIPVGTFTTNAVVIDVPIQFAPGASILRPANGQTITITGAITADTSQHFSNANSGQGTIDLEGNTLLGIVWATWWGAIGNGVTDCAPPINAAIVAMPATGGIVALSTGVFAISTTILVGSNVVFVGQGYQGTEIRALAGFTAASAMIRNTHVDGSQQQVAVGGFWINAASHADYGIIIDGVGQVSWVRDITINDCLVVGMVFNGGPPASTAGYFAQNIAVNTSGQQNIAIIGPIHSVWMDAITAQGQGAGFASILISESAATPEGRKAVRLSNVHLEMFGANSTGIDINNFSNVLVQMIEYIGAAPPTGDLIKVRGTSSNVTLQNVNSQSLLNLIVDTTVTPNVTIDVAGHGGEFAYYSNGDSQVENQTVNSLLTVGSSTLNDGSGLRLNQGGTDAFITAAGTPGDLYLRAKTSGRIVQLDQGDVRVTQTLNALGTIRVANTGKISTSPKSETYSNAVSIDVTVSAHLISAANGTSATSTFSPSAAGTAGDWLYITTETDGSGSVVVTFGGTFHSSGTQTTTASHFSTIAFQSDGSRWLEVYRTTNLA